MSATEQIKITLGTRRSKLARVQTDIVADGLKSASDLVNVEIHATDPLGDRDKTTALYELNNKNLWTGELEELLEKGEVDAIVHSLKDMPTTLPPGLILGAILERDSPLDVLCMKSTHSSKPSASAHDLLSQLPPNSLIGTSSLRRTAQLRRHYPHLRFDICRGNVPTRLAKLDAPQDFDHCPTFDALILAAAGVHRLGLKDRVSAYLDGSAQNGRCLYAVGQGAIGVEIREGDERVKTLIDRLNHTPTRWACMAERSLMRTLEGGCSVPIGVESAWSDGGKLELRGIVVSIDGNEAVETSASATVNSDQDAEDLGKTVAKDLVQKGASKILDVINEERRKQQEDAKMKIGDPKAFVQKQSEAASLTK